MHPTELWPWFDEANAALICHAVLRDDGMKVIERPCRVPVEHRALGEALGSAGLSVDGLGVNQTEQQLAAILERTGGVGLFAPARWSLDTPSGDPHRDQGAFGSVILWPATEWERLHTEFSDWMQDDPAAFDDTPFALDDLLVIAGINFSPDCWLLVTQGPLAGKIFFWSHEDAADFSKPWADDLRAWGNRVRREIHTLLQGTAFDHAAAVGVDDLPESAEFFPRSFEAGPAAPRP